MLRSRAISLLVLTALGGAAGGGGGDGTGPPDLSAAIAVVEVTPESLQDLAHALDTLAAVEPALAQLVELHFFCGFSFAESDGFRGVSERTIERDWRKARLLLDRPLPEP